MPDSIGKFARFLRHRHAPLLGFILLELIVFSIAGRHFLTGQNLLDMTRQSIELGLVALGMTAVIICGGIDLSVGSLLGLCAVAFARMVRDAAMPAPLAIIAVLAIGTAAGILNATLIARLRVSALIVTLGSYALFRGIAEGLAGPDALTGIPSQFTFLGRGFFGPVAVQFPIFILAAVAFYLMIHRDAFGRAISAIGYSYDGARYAGIRVQWITARAYVLCALCAAIAAMIHIARLGQATADAGSAYEFRAIAAVVLGGTSIFGGAGSISGTLLGLAAISLLRNGLPLCGLPSESADIGIGLLLLLALAADAWKRSGRKSQFVMA